MHEIAERCEEKLRKMFGGEAICHTDPLMEKTAEIQAIEQQFNKILKDFPQVIGYHDFRVVAESPNRIIIIADIDVKEDVPESEFKKTSKDLESRVAKDIPNIAYCAFYITPKFSY